MDGYDAGDLSGMMEKVTAGATAALGNIEMSGFSADNLTSMVEKVTAGATAAMGDIQMEGFSADNLTSMVEKVTSGATASLGKIEMTGYDSTMLTGMMEKVTSGATAALGDIKMEGFSADNLMAMVEKVTAGATAAMGQIQMEGFSADNLTSMVEKVTSGATASLGKIKMTGYDSTKLTGMMEKVTAGATEALGKIIMSGFDSNDLSGMVKKITTGATSALGKIQMEGFDSNDLSVLVDKVKSGTTEGLGKIQMEGFDPNNIPSDITNSIDSGLVEGQRELPPILKQVVAVPTPTNDTTPSYTFSSNKVGQITYGGSCLSSTASASAGNNIVTFDNLSEGTYSNCSIKLTDSDGITDTINVNTFTVDTTDPVIGVTKPIPSITRDSTPDYSFSTSEAGTINYGGNCTSDNITAIEGINTKTFNTLNDDSYSNCSIQVTDKSGNQSEPLNVNTFTVSTLYVLDVSSTNSDGEYRVGDNITIKIRFNEPVIFVDNGTEKLWLRQIGTEHEDSGNSITTDSSGNIYLTGTTKGGLHANTNGGKLAGYEDGLWDDNFLTKYDPSGILKWTKQWGTSLNDAASRVTTDLWGNIYVVGFTSGGLNENQNIGSHDFFISKFNSSGSRQWTKQHGTIDFDVADGITTDIYGNLYIAGATMGALDGNIKTGPVQDTFLIKYDKTGTRQWTKQLGDDGSDHASSITSGPWGNIYLLGNTLGGVDNYGMYDIFLIKYDTSNSYYGPFY